MDDKRLEPLLNELEGTLLFVRNHLEEYSTEDLEKMELEMLKIKHFLRKLKEIKDKNTKELRKFRVECEKNGK